jgi:hypothetical protein
VNYLSGFTLSLSPSQVTLEELVRTIGSEVVEVECAPAGLGIPISATVLDDPGDPTGPAATPGGILMLIAPDLEVVAPAVARARAGQFCALVVKRHGRSLGALVTASEQAGLAVLTVADEIPWRHLDALIASVLASGVRERTESDDARGEELFSVANAVAAVVGGSVAIEDLGQHVLAYSSIEGQRIDVLRRQGILDRRVPRGPQDQEMYRQVLSAPGVVRFPQLGEDLPRAAAAIRAGSLPLGTLWAIEGEAGLSAQAEAAVLDGARLAALHMLRSRNALDLDRLRRGELLRALLEDAHRPEHPWSRLGFAPSDRACLIGLSPAWSRDSADGLLTTNVAREIGRICSALRPDAPVVTIARGIYVLLAGPQPAPAARRLADRLVSDGSRALGGQIYAALSSEGAGARAVPGLRDEVDHVLRVNAGGLTAPEVATLGEVRTQLLLLHLRDELDRRPELADPGLAVLLAHDERRHGELSMSLLAWLEADQNVQAAATRLHVHPNTLRYRLRRGAEIANIDLSDPDQRLAAWLQLRAMHVMPEVSPRPR